MLTWWPKPHEGIRSVVVALLLELARKRSETTWQYTGPVTGASDGLVFRPQYAMRARPPYSAGHERVGSMAGKSHGRTARHAPPETGERHSSRGQSSRASMKNQVAGNERNLFGGQRGALPLSIISRSIWAAYIVPHLLRSSQLKSGR